MKRILWMTIALVAVALTGCSDDDDHKAMTVPEAFADALANRYPDAKEVRWSLRADYRVAEFVAARKEVAVWFRAEDASWVMTDIDLGRSLLSLPEAVATQFAGGDYGTWTIDEIDYYERPDRDFYVIEVENPGREDTDLFYYADGTFVKSVPSGSIRVYPDTSI